MGIRQPAVVGGRWCASCGQEATGRGCGNDWCRRADRGWSVVYSAAPYTGGVRSAIVGYKYRARRSLAVDLAALLARYVLDHPTWFEEYDLLTSVPAYRGPGARRAWDPAWGLTAALAGRLGPGWGATDGVVVKTAETPAMSGRTSFERGRLAEGPLRQSLRIGPVPVAGARILVVDDVLTGGGTLREVALVLRHAGAEEVAGLVLARPVWHLTRAASTRPVGRA